MKFLDEPALTMINTILNECKVGDRIIHGSIEAFSCKRNTADKKFAKSLESQYQQELAASPNAAEASTSPIGSLLDAPTRKLMINLISTMNASFPDYDFSSVRPEQFGKTPLKVIRHSINSQLAEMVEVHSNGFLEKLWRAIDLVIQPDQCDIYSYIPDLDDSDPFSGSTVLWSFNYLFYNKQLKKMLYFKCVSNSMFYEQHDDDAATATVQDGTASEDDDFEESDMMLDWEDGV